MSYTPQDHQDAFEATTIPPLNFCQTLHANVDNPKLSDAQFRELVRNTLPIVRGIAVCPPFPGRR